MVLSSGIHTPSKRKTKSRESTDVLPGWSVMTMSNFYSPLNGRSTYINTKNNIMAIREAKKNNYTTYT